MKWIKSLVWVVFGCAVIVFGVATVREFLNRDTAKPVIKSEQEEITIPCGYTYEEITEGLTASDEEDGDLTDQILLGRMSRFIETGVCDLTYVVFDSSNQSASLTRRIRFSDYESPEFRSSLPLVYIVKEGDYEQTMARLSVYDRLDGEMKDAIQVTASSVLYSTEGTYSMTLEATNNFGDTSTLEVPVHIVAADNLKAEIKLTQYIYYVNQGETFDPLQLIDEGQAGSLTKDQIYVISNPVNTGQPGVYEVQYGVDVEGQTSMTWATVVVR